MTRIAKRGEAYYSQKVRKHSYFWAASNGGRQASQWKHNAFLKTTMEFWRENRPITLRTNCWPKR